MPLPLDKLFCAARLIGEREKPEGGSEIAVLGTGFAITVAGWPYLITAHHVIDDQNEVEVQMSNPAMGGLLGDTSYKITNWKRPLPKADLAIARLDKKPMMAIRLENQVVRNGTGTVLFPGSVIYYVGHLDPLDRIMARSGTIGALDQEGLDLSVLHEKYEYTAHLVDCRSYEGFSGSPCFVDLPFAELEPTDAPLVPPEGTAALADLHHLTLLCGMFTHHLDDDRPQEDGKVSRYGVGVMLRANEIVEALMTKDLSDDRAERDAAAEAAKAASTPRLKPTKAGGSGNDEFEQFEDLTRKLVKTPKGEIDEKRKDARNG